MLTICKADWCGECPQKEACGGCAETDGHPFGGSCIAAEWIKKEGFEAYQARKQRVIKEINALGIKGLQVTDLNVLNGFYVNMEYCLPNGRRVKLLEDNRTYWGNQVEIPGSERCYGIAADDAYLLVCEYGCDGADPQIVLYQRRG
ncbi:MAG: DUF3795 domain-containing protein [Lachnospiraceae bacterium]|nr:DUF3795 domain-containing protein [Lachnospiraceae bacterium]